MLHLSAYTKSLTASTEEELIPVPDGIISEQNDHLFPSNDYLLEAAKLLGTDLQSVQLVTPKIRQISQFQLRPIQPSLVGGDNDAFCDMSERPAVLRAQEEIIVKALQDNAGAQRGTALLWFGDGILPVPNGEFVKIKATSTTTATANQWTLLDYTLENVLQSGRYGCIGVEHIGANAQAARLTFDNQFLRPGWPSLTDVNQRLPACCETYKLGLMGEFETYSMPRVEVLCNGATASHTIFFHLLRLG